MTSIYGMNNLKIRSAVIRNGCQEKRRNGQYLELKNHLTKNSTAQSLTLNIVMNRYTDEISKLAILAKLPVPKKATLNKIICKEKGTVLTKMVF
jgi:hypothetical protein